ncbi:hypothetical protein KY284_006206 [Solanum tuberosum]|nr:hypothetical protein KY284_006206 [Solanum tuberosum]
MEKVGKKLAVLVGCNYENTPYRLHGCHNDVLAMRDVLVNRFGFDSQHIELLMDKSGSPIMPTGINIKKALNKMVDEAEQGDIFVMFSLPQLELDLLKPLKQDEGILLSGCQANEKCQDVGGIENENQAYGAFSHAILLVLEKNCGPISYKELVMKSRYGDKGYLDVVPPDSWLTSLEVKQVSTMSEIPDVDFTTSLFVPPLKFAFGTF